ncbi:MAG TPA: prolyl oligopeptidase family serine peptidase [Fimbriimonas sp.]|nr:prolyl oligopeptidase family serine peptidase [Fimbriimonas sp.]
MTFLLHRLSLVVLAASAAHLSNYKPSPAELREAYRRADSLRLLYGNKSFNLTVTPHWYDGNHQFWYESEGIGGTRKFISVDETTGASKPLFDHEKMASALSSQLGAKQDASKLPISSMRVEDEGKTLHFNAGGKGFKFDFATETLTSADLVPGPRRRTPEPWVQNLWPADKRDVASPDGAWIAHCDGLNVQVKTKGGTDVALTTDGTPQAYFAKVEWRPDSKKIVAIRVIPGDRKPVYLIQSSPPGGGRAVLKTRPYDLPGDKLDSFDIWLLDPVTKEVKKIDADPLDGPFADMPTLRWTNDKQHFTYEKLDRGYQRWRLMETDAETGATKALIDDQAKTFVDTTSAYVHFCQNDEVIYRSEKDGWGQLYLYKPDGTLEDQITKGPWVVRGVDRVDEKNRQIVFHASGMNAREDPYFNHYYRVNFDGSGMTALTPAPGDHVAEVSPDGTALIDTCSTVSEAPVHELRRISDGGLLGSLGKADISELKKAGWKAPEPFVAKGRDGTTDIWGLIYRPSKFDTRKSYPVIEDIYAGPQDSFVPKNFAPIRGDQALAELGFIVVKIDGMGTRNRSRAFHDVCWKNLADNGFPDRILWMKAMAKKYPYADISRVGVFGTSAGGQASTAAVLFHPEFYKVAVSSCGCHDNRMDKVWWNEQWMGYPVGPEYAEQSNITNAGKLQGKLLLFVSELDTNVPPESTYRLVDALIHARKEFDMLVTPGVDHGQEGPFGERKRRDFFVHNLLGVEPPEWNTEADPPGGLGRR